MNILNFRSSVAERLRHIIPLSLGEGLGVRLLLTMTVMCTTQLHAQDFKFDEVTYTPEATTFKLFAPADAKKVNVLYLKGTAEKKIKMKHTGNGIWTATVKGDIKDSRYHFDVDGRQSVGVFAKAVGVNSSYGAVVDMKETNPEGWENDVRPEVKSPADLVLYEMHHRDFSIARNINLNPGTVTAKRQSTAYPGKYLALTEDWAIAHLQELGVNAIHILPSFDYASVDETRLDEPQYNWGYDPVNYNVPEGSYSTDPCDPKARIREFKQMVQALHKAGIRVILDVVYNHTFNIDGSNFQLTYPDYYYRKTADGSYSDGSGCGNETASDREMVRRFMIESVKYWISEYHIDGFRFDLMAVHDIETMNEIRRAVNEIDPTIFIYGEGWSAGTCAYPQDKLALKANIRQMPGIAAFSDDMRDALRGPFSDDTQGAFLAGIAGGEESIKAGIAGMTAHPQVDYSKVNYSKEPWAAEPTQMISYVSCHDDLCLVDRLRATKDLKTAGGAVGDDEVERLDMLAQTAVFLSQGVPFMLSGEELMRDKKGVHNSYNSPDSVNQLNWNGKLLHPRLFAYYKDLLRLRKNHPAFRLGSTELVCRHLEFLPSQDALVAFRLKDNAGGDAWRNIYVILNGSREQREVEVPAGSYTVVCRDGVIDEQGLGDVECSHPAEDGIIKCREPEDCCGSGSADVFRVIVGPQSALVFHD